MAHAEFKNDLVENSAVEEAVSSAIYEGANSTRHQAMEFIASKKQVKTKDEQMLINNYRAMKWIKDNVAEEISLGTVLKLHEIVTINTLGDEIKDFSGVFRNDKVYVGGNHEGTLHNKIETAVQEMIRLITEHPRHLNRLLKGIFFHYFIAYIHPFFDGNGRTARAVFYFNSMKNELDFVENLSISANLKEKKKAYEKSFELVLNHDLDLTYFVDFCLDSLMSALKAIEVKLRYLIDIALLKDPEGLTFDQIKLLQSKALNKFSYTTIEEHAAAIRKSREVARRELNHLVDRKLFVKNKVGKMAVFKIDAQAVKQKVELLKT